MHAKSLRHLFAILGAVFSLVITAFLWKSIASQQEIWPLPGLYLIEMATVSVLGTLLAFCDNRALLFLNWIGVGAMTGFVVAGTWSIGPSYAVVVLLQGIAAILALKGQTQGIPICLSATALGAITQISFMLALTRILEPNPF